MKDMDMPSIEDLDNMNLDGDVVEDGHHQGDDGESRAGHGAPHDDEDDEVEDEASEAEPSGRARLIRIGALLGGAALAGFGAVQVPAIRSHIPFVSHGSSTPVMTAGIRPPAPGITAFPKSFPGQGPISQGPTNQNSGIHPQVSAPVQMAGSPGLTSPNPGQQPSVPVASAVSMPDSSLPSPDSLNSPSTPVQTASVPNLPGVQNTSMAPAAPSVAPITRTPAGPEVASTSANPSVSDFLSLVTPRLDKDKADVQATVESAKSAILIGQDDEKAGLQKISDKLDSIAKAQSELSDRLASVTAPVKPVHQKSGAQAVRKVTAHVAAPKPTAAQPAAAQDSVGNYRLVGYSKSSVLIQGPHGWFVAPLGQMARGQDGREIPAIGVVQNLQNVDGAWEVTTSTGGVIRQPRSKSGS